MSVDMTVPVSFAKEIAGDSASAKPAFDAAAAGRTADASRVDSAQVAGSAGRAPEPGNPLRLAEIRALTAPRLRYKELEFGL